MRSTGQGGARSSAGGTPGADWLIAEPSLMKCSLIQPWPVPGPLARLACSHMLSVEPGTLAVPL